MSIAKAGVLWVWGAMVLGSMAPGLQGADAGLTFERLAALRSVREVAVSPDGSLIAYVLHVPRTPGEGDDGPAWNRLHVVDAAGGRDRAFVHGEVSVSKIRFTPDGGHVSYLAKRDDDEHTALWYVPLAGGESFRVASYETSLSEYDIAPDGKTVAFVATEPESKGLEKAREKGYKQEVFEEQLRPRKLWLAPVPPARPAFEDPAKAADKKAAEKAAKDGDKKGEDKDEPKDPAEPRALPIEGSVYEVDWSPDGKRLAVTVAPRNAVDDRYMRRRIRIVDADSGKQLAALDNPGKLGKFLFSPDGRNVAMISAADPNDPKEGRLMVGPATGGKLRELLPGLEGHVADMAWKDASTLMLIGDDGVESWFGEMELRGVQRKMHHRSGNGKPLMRGFDLSADGKIAAFVGESPRHPSEVFVLGQGDVAARRLTDSNPWLDDVELARQEVITWKARDGLELQGMLVHPLGARSGASAPLLLMVHGGPEAHDRNGWVTAYSRPGQLAAARGYAVLYPNYRGSTGRGVAFSKLGQGDAAGKEFDDLIDAVEHLVAGGVADRNRVGINGGSYGGYATAWCATRFTEHFKAGAMFVGITNKVSKGLTTEIPYEDRMVHTLFDPWDNWQFSLERSPVFHAEKSRTALLIVGGTEDSRVHPSQSLQLYRALKLIGKTPVRYVRYPGEGHGNSKAAARDDYTRRLMRWMDHFVVEGKTELPPWDLHGHDVEDEDGE